MENQGEPSRSGNVILDRYMAASEPEEREEAREQLRRFLAWQMRIIMRQVREELADSPDTEVCDTLDSANLLP